MTTAMKITRVQLFENIGNPEEIISAIRRKDSSYLNGVIKWYEKHPKNPILVCFLKKVQKRFSSQD